MNEGEVIVRRCGFSGPEEVRKAAKRHGALVAPMKRDPEIDELLRKWDATVPVEY